MGNKYEIIVGDCLEKIAKRLNISVADLQAMNSDQIKNVDLIYAGNLINIPYAAQEDQTENQNEEIKPAPVSKERIQLPELPEAPGNVCEPMEYVDVVFFPSMPKTGKQGWFAITQQAKELLDKEIADIRSIMKAMLAGDVNDAMMELSKYGILSKFQSSDHERFLEDQDEKDRYRALLILQLGLKLEVLNVPEFLFEQAMADEEIASEFYVRYESAYKEQKLWEACDNLLNIAVKGVIKTSIFGFLTDGPTKEDLKLNYTEVRNNAIKDVMKQLAGEIDKLEKKARKQAKKKLSDDGTPFSYSENMGYFSSEQQNTIHQALANIHKARGMYSLELNDICEDSSSAILRRLKLWQQDSYVASKLTPYEFRARFAGRFTPIFTLNTNNMVLIEQCLTDEDLISQEPKTFKYHDDFDDVVEEKLLAEILGHIPNLRSSETISGIALPWSYYPCLALSHKLDASLKSKMSDLQTLLGVGKLPKQVLGDLVYCKKALMARIEFFETTAKANAKEGSYQRLFTVADKVYTPVLNEKEWKPARKVGSLYTDAGKADLSVVECYLGSEKGRISFVRGPSWMMPEDSNSWTECGDHYFDLKPSFKSVEHSKPMPEQKIIEGEDPIPEAESSPSTETVLEKCVNAYFAELVKKFPIKANFQSSLADFDKALVKKVYEWKPEGPHIDETNYHVSSECQFMRFSAAVSVGDTLDAEKVVGTIKDKAVKFGMVDAKVDLNLAQGQSTLTVQYPSATGYHFRIPYIAYLPSKPLKIKQETFYKAAREEQARLFDAGYMMLQGSFTVYGMVGASINLGASVEFGNLDQGGVGVKGSTESYQGYNAHRKDVASIKNADGELLASSKAADMTATASVFAGVEAGGEFVGSFNWRHPKSKSFVPFGQFTAKASAAFAASASGVLKLTVSGGKIIFIMAARLALGPGVGGKIGFEISPYAINDFIDHILTIMDQEGYRRLNIFDESIDKESGQNSFELFNMFLTTIMMTGLRAADVLFLPFEQIEAFNEESTREKLAPVLADFINNEAEDALPWVKKMPPETMGRLLFTLSDAQNYSILEIAKDVWNRNNNEETRNLADDIKQRNAIQRVMAWLVGGRIIADTIKIGSNPTDKQVRYFEEVIIRINQDGSKADNKIKEWISALINMRILIGYHSKISEIEDGQDKIVIEERMLSFRKVLNLLAKNYLFYARKGIMGEDYYTYYIGDCDKDLEEQNSRMAAVGINDQFYPVSIIDVKGIR